MKKMAIVLTLVVAVAALGGTYYFKQLKPQNEVNSLGAGANIKPADIFNHNAHH